MTGWRDIDPEILRAKTHAERSAQGLPLEASEVEIEMASAIITESLDIELAHQ